MSVSEFSDSSFFSKSKFLYSLRFKMDRQDLIILIELLDAMIERVLNLTDGCPRRGCSFGY